jgi:hypothetical protein
VRVHQAYVETALLATSDLVFEHELQELHVAEASLFGLVHTCLQGVEHTSEAQALELGL